MFRRPAAAALVASAGFLDRVVCVIGAVLAAQAPEFFQQYLQRLGGHLAEALRQLATFEAAARAAGKPWAQFVADTSANADPGVAQLGTAMADTAARVDSLGAAQAALLDASVWSRPWAFLHHLDTEIAQNTLAVFKPAVPTTAEGGIYAAVGIAIAFGLWQLLVFRPLRRLLGPANPASSAPRSATRPGAV